MKIWIPIKGGYLSTCMESEHPIGFAAYCRMREKSIDPRFREDEYYGFFTQQIKELIELKRSKQIYSRQIKRNPTLTQAAIEHQRMDELEKVNKNFSVYKNIRGTTMYYDSVKKNAMAYLRQLGSPHLFFNISFAEFQDDILFKQVLETVLNRVLTEEEIVKMKITPTERSKIICKNVVQTTFCFERRLQKLLNLLTNDGFGTSVSKKRYYAENFFYRIEFQIRGEISF